MAGFWPNCGYQLLAPRADGQLALTDAFLLAYWLRPEVRPVDESGPAERALHAALIEDPRRPLDSAMLARIEDPDTRFNYEMVARLRDRLVAAGTIEACYAGFFAPGAKVDVPPLFLDQLAHVIVRHILDGTDDALAARAGELFFREQKATLENGRILLADEETVAMHASGTIYGTLGRLIVEAQTALGSVSLDVLDTGNAGAYWSRDERHDFVIEIGHGRAALAAFARVIESWVLHFTGCRVSVTPLARIEDSKWAWQLGLDAQSTALMNTLWRGEALEPGDARRLLALFRLEFADRSDMRAELEGAPVYTALAMDAGGTVKMKPQNLLVNLPLARRA